jgi:hypothetical protein
MTASRLHSATVKWEASSGSATAYVAVTGEGVSAGGNVSGTLKAGGASTSVNVDIPVLSSKSRSGDNCVGRRINRKLASLTTRTSWYDDEGELGGTYGEGLVGGASLIFGGLQAVGELGTTVLKDVISDVNEAVQTVQQGMTMTGRGRKPDEPTPPQ